MTRAFLLLVLLPLFNVAAYAQDKALVVGVENLNYYPLYDFRDGEVNRPSFTYDLLKKFFDSHNIPFKFVALPIKRVDKWYLDKSIDFKFPDNKKWREGGETRLNITYSDPVIQLEAGTFVLKKNAKITREQVNVLGTITAFYPVLWINEVNNKKVKLMEDKSPISLVKHLLYGNTDGVNIDINVINANLKKLNHDGDVVLAKNITHKKYYYYLSSINHPEIIDKFNVFIKENAMFIKQLKQKYHIKG